MSNYTIDIHSVETQKPKTQINDVKSKTELTEDDDTNIGLKQIVGAATNPIGSSIGLLTKAVPMVATIMAIGAVAYKTVDYTCNYVFTKTGNIGGQRALTNFHQTMSAFMNPIGAINNAININLQNEIANSKIEQQRLLVGNSITNNKDMGAS